LLTIISNYALESNSSNLFLTDTNGKNAVETCNFEILLTDISGKYAEEGTNEVTQMALCSCLFLCDHF